jgi:FkbM family methyltransferase
MGLELGTLPDGRPIYYLNWHETEFFYRQIFIEEGQLRGQLRQAISLPPGACIFDVGANIGLFTLFGSDRCPGAKVYAFEPVPEIFEALRRNSELHARVFPFGLSDSAGEVEVTFYPRESCMSGSYADRERDRGTLERILRNAGLGGDGSEAYLGRMLEERIQHRLVRCTMRTLSDVLRQERVARVDLLKIDVERSELDVLRGLGEEDWPKIRQIVIEAHDVDGRLDAVCALLRHRGYRIVLEQEAELRGTELFNLYAVLQSGEDTALSGRVS